MENLNLPPFYIGQKVVAIRNHQLMAFKIGDKFTITCVRMSCCGWVVQIGNNFGFTENVCSCGEVWGIKGHKDFKASSFRAIQEQKFPLIKLTKVIEKEKELVSAN